MQVRVRVLAIKGLRRSQARSGVALLLCRTTAAAKQG